MCEVGGLRDEATWGGSSLTMGHLWDPALSKDLIPGQWGDMVRCELENDPLDSLTWGGSWGRRARSGENPGQPGW